MLQPEALATTGCPNPWPKLPRHVETAGGSFGEDFRDLKMQFGVEVAFGNESVRPLRQTGGPYLIRVVGGYYDNPSGRMVFAEE